MNARDYSLADEYRPEEKPQAWAEYAKYLFPFEMSFTSPLDGYVKPRIAEVSFQALWLGLALGAFYALIRRRSPGGRLWQTVGVVLFRTLPLRPAAGIRHGKTMTTNPYAREGRTFSTAALFITRSFPDQVRKINSSGIRIPAISSTPPRPRNPFRAAHHHQPGKHDYDQSR